MACWWRSACVIQLASTQLIGGRQTAQAATANRTLTVTLSAKRGRILDANGSVLAQSVERYTIVANPEAAQEFEPITCNDNTRDYCHEIDGKPVGATGAAAVGRLLAKVLDMNAMELGADLSVTGPVCDSEERCDSAGQAQHRVVAPGRYCLG